MKKIILAALFALYLFSSASAQTSNVSKILVWQLNLNQVATPTYCAPSSAVSTADRVTAAASTTLTAVSGAPFANVSVGAWLHIIDSNGTDYRRTVTIRTSATSVVVSGAALTITSGKIQADSQNVACGTGVTAGWFSVAGMNKISIQVDVTQQVNTGGLSFHLQCRTSGDAQRVQVYPVLTFPTVTPSYTSALASGTTGSLILSSQDPYDSCRVGMFIVTADDGNDLTTNAEQVSLTLLGRPN